MTPLPIKPASTGHAIQAEQNYAFAATTDAGFQSIERTHNHILSAGGGVCQVVENR
jgi:hypothetical protein